jgi:hypothetical protein
MTVELKGIFTPPAPETRDIAHLEVVHNGNTYNWMVYTSQGVDIADSLASMETRIYAEIDYKEAQWAALEPKTKTIQIPPNPLTGESTVVVDIAKEEVVKPDYPDYYALRRNEYPLLGDQLGGISKGIDSAEYQDILTKIQAVKDKYPKPPYI